MLTSQCIHQVPRTCQPNHQLWPAVMHTYLCISTSKKPNSSMSLFLQVGLVHIASPHDRSIAGRREVPIYVLPTYQTPTPYLFQICVQPSNPLLRQTTHIYTHTPLRTFTYHGSVSILLRITDIRACWCVQLPGLLHTLSTYVYRYASNQLFPQQHWGSPTPTPSNYLNPATPHSASSV